MRLADDRRGRVPFALLGVLLLLGSASLVATRPAPSRPTPSVDHAVQETTSASRTALRTAARTAGRQAAQSPLTAPADTRYGRVVAGNESFEDALRLRLYTVARSRLASVTVRAGDTVGTATLPPIDSPAGARRAIERVAVSRAGPDGTLLRVRIENVTIRATRDGRVVGRRVVSPAVTVSSPVLALHDRVERFERRLNAGPLEPGLGRRITASLYAIAWTRGYAQYGGANISNVVANRHVGLVTNGGTLAVQRRTLGASDPESERAHDWATARVGATDLASGIGLPPEDIETLSTAVEQSTGRDAATGFSPDRPTGARPNATVTVTVGQAAETALAETTTGGIERALGRVYSVDVRPVVRVEHGRTTTSRGPSPGPAWTRVNTTTTVERSASPTPATVSVRTPSGWRLFDHRTVDVTAVHVERTVWRRGAETRTTRTFRTERYTVGVAIAARHSPDAAVDRRGIETVYQRTDGTAGPNLADVRTNHSSVVEEWGGYESIALTAVGDDDFPTTQRLVGSTPVALGDAAKRDVVELHQEVRSLGVELPRSAVGTYDVSPAARLADLLRDRRVSLVDAPRSYRTAGEKARYEARRAYVDRVIAALERRALSHEAERTRFRDVLDDAGVDLDHLRRVAATSDASLATGTRSSRFPVSVDTAPEYLSLETVPADRLEVRDAAPTRPLVARNLNVFTVPYGEAATGVVGSLFGPRRVGLSTAAATLRAVEETPVENATLRARRAHLSVAVGRANAFVRTRLRATLQTSGIGQTPAERRAIVEAGLRQWPSPGERGVALANGAAVRSIAREAPVSEVKRATLRAALNRTRTDALARTRARVPRPVVAGTAESVRAVARRHGRRIAADAAGRVAATATERAAVRLSAGRLAAIPAGFPVAPVPGYWYVTVNVWQIRVAGVYERVSVRAHRGVSDTVYTRDGSTVSLDVDGDGDDERLGRSTRIGFETGTVVLVVVPPGGRGVGDTDGVRDERSPGWPVPGRVPETDGRDG